MIPHSIQPGSARRCHRLVLLSLLSLAGFAGAARAQTVDYGALEQLFGESVTTSATGQPQRVTEVPAAMEIVPAEKIRRSGAVDIPGVLKQVPGVDVMQWGTNNADISVRGYDQAFSPRLLVLVDGRQVYADHYGYTPWTAVPVELSAIRQIEVVKGPNTALFGANAVSGVINIITYNPLYDDVNSISVTGGTQGTIRGSAVATIQNKGVWALRISGSAGLDNDFSSPIPASFFPAQRSQNTRGAVDIDGVVQLAPNLQAGLEFSHAETFSNDMGASYGFKRDRHSATSIKGQVNAETRFGLVQFLGYTNWTVLDEPNPVGAFYFGNQSTVLQLQDVVRLGASHVLRGAIEFRHNEIQTTPVGGGRVFYDTPSFSGMWNWTISPELSWTNAVRYDSLSLGRSGIAPPGYPFPNSAWNRTLSQWSFNSGLVWKAGEDDTLRAMVSRGIELPSLAHFGGIVLTTPFFNSSGNPAMRASAVMNYELNWDHGIAALGGNLRAALFLQKTTDVTGLVLGLVPPPMYTLTGNIGNSDAVGGEIALDGRITDNWRWGVSYRLETIKDKFTPFAANGNAFSDFQHTTPKHQARANLGWSQNAWEADLAVYYQSRTRGLVPTVTSSTLVPVQDYFNTDFRVGYRINDTLTLSLSGQNLLTAHQQQTSGPEIQRRLFLNLTAGF